VSTPASTAARTSATDHGESRSGTAYGFLAYSLWGLFPLYFHALAPSGPWEILANRILWTLVFCGGVLLARRDLAWVVPLVRRRRLTIGVTIAAFLIATNWTIYVYAVVSGHVVEAALGYFLNPLVTVAMGVLILRERLRPLQWLAVGIGFVAAVYLTVDYGRPPWISFALAMTFASYGLAKNKVGATLKAMHSLAAETAILLPVSFVILVVLAAEGESTFVGYGTWHTTLLLAAGIVTAIPLLLFAAAARRIPLSLVGLLQFVTPTLQLLCGVVLLGEQVPSSRWVGFALVWMALGVLSVDSVTASRVGRVRADIREGSP
jgi:chloramphenicol-sensitive protein RarD